VVLRDASREAFLNVGELDHTFALKPAHTQNAWAATSDPGRHQGI